MVYEFGSIEEYYKAYTADNSLTGLSPGGAGGRLGLTRQGVYNAIKRGSLDLIRIGQPFGSRDLCLLVPFYSIESYLANRRGRKGPAPGFRQKTQLLADKYVQKVWPNL